MKRPLLLLLAALMLLLTAVSRAESNDTWRFAVVSNPDPADRLNLRAKPDKGSISLGKFYNGTPVTVLSEANGWAQVSLYKDFEGYMDMDYLAFGEEARSVASAMPVVTVVAPAGKTVHDSMLDHPAVSASFAMGAQLEVMGVMEDWLFVRSGESIAGFTKNSGTMPRVYFSSPEATPPAQVSVVATPTPSPTPLPAAADGRVYARVTVDTQLYADEALTHTLAVLKQGRILGIESAGRAVCRTTVGTLTGYVDASCLSFGSDYGPGYGSAAVEGARSVTKDDWIVFAAVSNPTTLFADKTLTHPIHSLEKGEFFRVLNDMYAYATVVSDGQIAGYIPAGAENFTIHSAAWPFHIEAPSAVVNNPLVSDRLHLREAPDKQARSLGRYYNGTVVTLLDSPSSAGDWAHVSIGGVQGYMMSQYLDFTPAPGEHHPCMSLLEIANPNTGNLHLRAAPDTGAKSLGLYENGALVAVMGVVGDWVHVICDGQMGYMLHRHLKTALGTSFDPYY